MTSNTISRYAQSGLCLLMAICATTEAKTLTVGHLGTACQHPRYSTISAAVNAASSGDVITICPSLYAEQVVITKPLTLRGIAVNGINRVLIQPASMIPLGGLNSESVITVMNTRDVELENLAIDASNNTVSGCVVSLSAVHFLNASGEISGNAISGAQLASSTSCPGVFGNGYGVLIDSDGTQPGPFQVTVKNNSIHDYTKNGVFVVGPGVNVASPGVSAEVSGNSISGIGPGVGTLQFGVFILNGAVGKVTGNRITEGTCGALSLTDCFRLRSEGVTLRAVGDGTVVDGNIINNAQSGIFVNGGNKVRITNNVISNIEGLDGIDVQGTAAGFFTNSLIAGNTFFNLFPVSNYACGIWEYSGTGLSGNTIVNNNVTDAYCGVAYVTADHVVSGSYSDTLYTTFNTDVINGPDPVEPALAPGRSRMNRLPTIAE